MSRRAYPTAPYVPITPVQQPVDQQPYTQPTQPTQTSLSYGNSASSIGYIPPPETQYPYYRKNSEDTLSQGMGSLGISNYTPSTPQFDLFSSTPSVYDMFETVIPRVPLTMNISESMYANADSSYKRCTMNALPNAPHLYNKCNVPFGILVTPLKNILPGENAVPVISSPKIVRCRRCKSYINPWVSFVEQGTRWKCNMCSLANEVPSYFDWDPTTNTRVDRRQRPELSYGVVEYIASQEYMLRPPQPVIFLFVIDVSFNAISSGMLNVFASTILNNLDLIPNEDGRTKIGFITVDNNLHFYNLDPSLSEPQMMVVSDLSDDGYLPLPCFLTVSLSECRTQIESLCSRLGSFFKDSHETRNNLPAALNAAQKILNNVGGKIIVFQSTLPNAGDGGLKDREDVKLLGTPKEVSLLQPANNLYKSFSVNCSPNQIGIDLFLFGPKYVDVATLCGLSRFSSGSLFYYPNFQASKYEDAAKFALELGHLISRPLGLEAVLRIRASKGITATAYHGNFFLRSTDLLALPNVSPDNSYAVEMSVTEPLNSNVACFQTALLYTTSFAERRIRVLTLCVPVTGNMTEIYSNVDHVALSALLIKKGIDRALTSKLEDAREALEYKLIQMIATYKASLGNMGHPGMFSLPMNLKLLPALVLGMLQNAALRHSTTIPSDLRSYYMSCLYSLSPECCMVYLYPRIWPLHDMKHSPQIGELDADGRVHFSEQVSACSSNLAISNGVFLMDNGLDLFIWVSKSADADLLLDVFGVDYSGVPNGKIYLSPFENDTSVRLHQMLSQIRLKRRIQNSCYPHLYIVKPDGDPSLRIWFLSHLIEDKFESIPSYQQFLSMLREQVMKLNISL